MTGEENKAAVSRHLDLSWNKREIDSLDSVWADDAILHLPGGVTLTGSATIKQYLSAAVGAYADRELVINDIVAEGETVATRWTFTAAQIADVAGTPGNGAVVKITGMDFYRMRDGKIMEEWFETDLFQPGN